MLGIVQWEAQESDTSREAKRETGGRSEVLLDTEGQDSRSDLLRILLFTNLWTSSARLHFNVVLWRSALDGSGAGSRTWQACSPVIMTLFCAGVWEPGPLTCVAAVKADPQNSHGGPLRAGRGTALLILLLWAHRTLDI